MMSREAKKALRRKDAPWIWLFALGGSIALVSALGDGGFFASLAFPPGRSEAEFHVAWICGLALGVVVPVFDAGLGLRDHLRQRPLALTQLFWHRVRTMVRVLTVWLLAVPVGAWLLMATFEGAYAPDPVAIAEYWVAVLPAISAAAIGLLAMTLPVTWWLRPVVAAALFFVVFSLVHEVTWPQPGTVPGSSALVVHIGLHLLVAVAAVFAARAVCESVFDPDRPVAAGVRRFGGLAAVLAIGCLTLVMLARLEGAAARELLSEYPRIVQHDAAIKLADGSWGWREGRLRFVDAAHRPTGEVAERTAVVDDFARRRWSPGSLPGLEFAAPIWHRRLSRASNAGRRLYLDHRGRAWLRIFDGDREMLAIGKTTAGTAFEPGARLHADWVANGVTLLHEPQNGAVYRFDWDARRFAPIELPRGQRVQSVGWDDVPILQASEDGTPSRVVIRAAEQSFVMNGDELVEVPRSADDEGGPDRPSLTVTGGPIVFSAKLEAGPDHPAFEHVYRPHTWSEYLFAAVAVVIASVQAPGYAWVFHAQSFESPNIWLYVALSLATAIAGALLAVRRLRRIGAPLGVRQYWLWLTVILGPVALLLSIVFERPRAYRDRPRFTAARPRVFTSSKLQEKAS